MEHQEAMELAIQKASESLKAENGPFGAAILKGDQLIVAVRNTSSEDNDPTAHAEVNAIRKACQLLGTKNLSGYVLYTSCHPCPMCLSAAKWAQLDKIYYALTNEDTKSLGFDDNAHYKEMSRSPEEREMPFEQLLQNQAKKVLLK